MLARVLWLSFVVLVSATMCLSSNHTCVKNTAIMYLFAVCTAGCDSNKSRLQFLHRTYRQMGDRPVIPLSMPVATWYHGENPSRSFGSREMSMADQSGCLVISSYSRRGRNGKELHCAEHTVNRRDRPVPILNRPPIPGHSWFRFVLSLTARRIW